MTQKTNNNIKQWGTKHLSRWETKVSFCYLAPPFLLSIHSVLEPGLPLQTLIALAAPCPAHIPRGGVDGHPATTAHAYGEYGEATATSAKPCSVMGDPRDIKRNHSGCETAFADLASVGIFNCLNKHINKICSLAGFFSLLGSAAPWTRGTAIIQLPNLELVLVLPAMDLPTSQAQIYIPCP